MASQLARQLGPRGGHWGYTQKWSTYINTHDRLDKLRSALAEAQLKNKHTFYVNNHSPNIFPVLANFSLCQNKIPCVFPVWKK